MISFRCFERNDFRWKLNRYLNFCAAVLTVYFRVIGVCEQLLATEYIQMQSNNKRTETQHTEYIFKSKHFNLFVSNKITNEILGKVWLGKEWRKWINSTGHERTSYWQNDYYANRVWIWIKALIRHHFSQIQFNTRENYLFWKQSTRTLIIIIVDSVWNSYSYVWSRSVIMNLLNRWFSIQFEHRNRIENCDSMQLSLLISGVYFYRLVSISYSLFWFFCFHVFPFTWCMVYG